MYFGYAQLWTFTFVPVGFVIVMAASLSFALVYFAGYRGGKRAATRHTRAVTYAFVAASAADVLYGVVTGDLSRFLTALGPGPLVEMLVLAAMCVGSLWFMAVSYSNSKKEG